MEYILLKRSERVALFSVNGGRYYEVSRISIQPAEHIFGYIYPEREALPTNEEFGKDGSRFFKSRTKAHMYFIHLNTNFKRNKEVKCRTKI